MAQIIPAKRVFNMLYNEKPEQQILQYINNNIHNIDVNYIDNGATMLSLSIASNYYKVMKTLLDKGALLDDDSHELVANDFSFSIPVAQAKELMFALINAGISKEEMLTVLCGKVSEVHKELLNTLLEQDFEINGRAILNKLIITFAESTEAVRGIFIEMLRILLNKGANPNETGSSGNDAIQLVSNVLADRNPSPIVHILETYLASAPMLESANINYTIVEPGENIFYEELEDGTTIALLDPKFHSQYIVAVRANGTPTNSWKQVLKTRKNPWTRAIFNPSNVKIKKTIIGPSINMNGGRRRKLTKRQSLRRKSQPKKL